MGPSMINKYSWFYLQVQWKTGCGGLIRTSHLGRAVIIRQRAWLVACTLAHIRTEHFRTDSPSVFTNKCPADGRVTHPR